MSKNLNAQEIQFKSEQEFLHNLAMFNAEQTRKIKTHLTHRLYPKNYEKTVGPSLTVPDQAMSLKQIMDRFAKGIPMNQLTNREPIYTNNDESQGIPIERLDLAERQQLMEENAQYIENLQNQLQAHQAAKKAQTIQTHTTPPETPPTGL